MVEIQIGLTALVYISAVAQTNRLWEHDLWRTFCHAIIFIYLFTSSTLHISADRCTPRCDDLFTLDTHTSARTCRHNVHITRRDAIIGRFRTVPRDERFFYYGRGARHRRKKTKQSIQRDQWRSAKNRPRVQIFVLKSERKINRKNTVSAYIILVMLLYLGEFSTRRRP